MGKRKATDTLDQQLAAQGEQWLKWSARFNLRQRKTRLLWIAIRREFEAQHPMTVRGAFYQLEAHGYVPKTEAGVRAVQRQILRMRRAGALDYSWVTDGSRTAHFARTYDGLDDALAYWQRTYRRALWQDQVDYVEIWIEKDALSGVFAPITEEYDVILYVARGFSSETYAHDCARYLIDKSQGKRVSIYHFGDHDPSGRAAARDIEKKLRGFGANFTWIEAAVTEQQIADLNLPTRPTKTKGNSHAKRWIAEGKGRSVELDAIPPNILRQMLREVIERHIDRDTLESVRVAEYHEKMALSGWIDRLRRGVA